MKRPTITVGVQPNTKLLRIERVLPQRSEGARTPLSRASRASRALLSSQGAWMVWINANSDFTCGTFMLLHDDGCIERVTSNADGTEDVFLVRKGD